MTEQPHTLSVLEKVGYGLGDTASNFFWQTFALFIMFFYTNAFGIAPAAVGTMILVTRIGDTFVDPIVGIIADRTKSRWGRFRPYLLWLAIPMGVTAVLTFTTPGFSPTGKLVYAYVTLSLMMVAYSAINIPYSALMGVMTPSSIERTSLSSYRFVLAFVAAFIVQFTTKPIVKFFGAGNENSAAGWQMAMVIFSIAAALLFLVTFATTKERVQPPKEAGSALKNDLKDLTRNKPWMVLFFVGIFALNYASIRNAAAIYYFKYSLGQSDLFEKIMASSTAAFILGVMITRWATGIFGKRNFYMGAMIVTSVFTILFYFIPKEQIGMIWAAQVAIQFVSAPTAPLVWAMYADTADYSEWKSGRRATGLVFSAASFAQKFGWAIGGALAGWLLGGFGFDAKLEVQNAGTQHGIVLMMSFIPAVGSILAAIALWFYPLTEPMMKTIEKDLTLRRAEQQPDAA
jgi:glycoside/pentoside/hexuronide:cation symporter, GPH family